MNSLQQIKGKLIEGNVMEEERTFVEDCKCKSLRKIKEGFKCFDCGKSFWWTEWK